MLTAGQHLFLTRRVRGPDFDARPNFFRPFFPMLQCSIRPDLPRHDGLHDVQARACRDANPPVCRAIRAAITSRARHDARTPARARAPPRRHSRADGRDPPQYTPPSPRIFPAVFPPSRPDPHPGKTKYTPPPLNFVSLKFEISVLWFCRVVLVLIDWKPLSVYWSGTTHRRKI